MWPRYTYPRFTHLVITGRSLPTIPAGNHRWTSIQRFSLIGPTEIRRVGPYELLGEASLLVAPAWWRNNQSPVPSIDTVSFFHSRRHCDFVVLFLVLQMKSMGGRSCCKKNTARSMLNQVHGPCALRDCNLKMYPP